MAERGTAEVAAALDAAIRLHRRGRLRDAFARYRAILDAHPEHAQALHLAGVVLHQSGEHAKGIDLIRRSIALDPAPADPWVHLAQALDAIGRREAAHNALIEAARRAPLEPAVWSNLAASELALERPAEAETAARRAVEIDARHAAGWFNLALALLRQHRVVEALDAASRAAAVAPEVAGNAGLLAQIQEDLGRYPEALETLARAIARHPTAAPLHAQAARVRERSGDLTGAVQAFAAALRLDPANGAVLSQLLFLRKRLCDWRELDVLQARFRSGVATGQRWLAPFSLLSDPSTRSQQRACAERWSAQFRSPAPEGRRRRVGSGARLRIGYLSSDYYDHPTAVLVAGLFERHDRRGFEIVGYSTGPDDGSALRARVAAACTRFVDAAGWSPERLAAQVRDDRVDILVDLKGHTEGAPTAALALRPAPIQAHYLGYPGTLGAPYVDYLIGDAVVTPFEHQGDYAETLVHLPGSYQANDRARVPAATPERAALGLPPKAVVLCCFNNTYKLNASVLDAWTRVLRAAPDAVLWLLSRGEGDPAIANLRRELAARDVHPDRLVFATHRPQAEYLALYAHADLFLDTWPYNAHTTASDALWMGCPLVTWLGETFAGRVGASLLTAVGRRELIATEVDGYVDRAIRIATDAAERARLRSYLLGAGRASPLFDAAATARALESAYQEMARQYRARQREAFRVEQIVEASTA